MRRWMTVLAFVVVASGCSSDANQITGQQSTAVSTVAPAESSSVVSELPAAESSTTTTRSATPGVAAMSSGRGDDGSLEVGVWFGSDPFASGSARIRIGTDADDSYPGVGNPLPHIDAWAELSIDGVTLIDAGAVVADQGSGDIADWVSWTGPGRSMFVYFLQTVPVRAGTVWVIVDIDGTQPVGGMASAPLAERCSYQSAGIDLGPVPGDVPDFGTPCRYPSP